MLQNNATYESYNFPCNRWLSKDELDQRIELDIPIETAPTSNVQKSPILGLHDLMRIEKLNSQIDKVYTFPQPSGPIQSQQVPQVGLKELIREEKMNVLMQQNHQTKTQSGFYFCPRNILLNS